MERPEDHAARRLLTVDAGNSTLDCLRHDTGERAVFARGEGGDALAAFARTAGAPRCIAVSVVEAARRELLDAFAGVRVRFAGDDLPCPLPIAYDTPETLGADRWVGALAAHRRFGAAVIVDCGTATTVNLVEADGTFRGGAIAPGLSAFVAGLAAVTPVLPTPNLDARPECPPRSTRAAVETGVLLGWSGLVERLVDEIESASTAPAPPRLVVTGGNAERLRPLLRRSAEFVPDLVHRGLALLDEEACAG